VVRVGEVTMLSIMAWQDDNGCPRWADCAGLGEARVSSPRSVRERIEGEGPRTARVSRAIQKICSAFLVLVSF
jgi:hypothetical protein